MRKIIIFFGIFFLSFSFVFAGYTLEDGSKKIVERFGWNTKNLDKSITREEFVNTLYDWYKDYRSERKMYVDYLQYKQLDNNTFFKDVDLDSEFGEKLEYFAHLGAFSKNQYFQPKGEIDQKAFFIVMKRLGILSSLQQCKNLKICEKEADENTYFLKGTYYKYVSKIFYKDLRKYFSTPKEYLNAGYKPFLKPTYAFPNAGQNLNGCYAFSVRNILKYKHNIGVYISKVDEHIGRKPTSLRTYPIMNKYDDVVHVDRYHYYNLDTLMHSLQAGEPIGVSYMLDYYSYKEKKWKQVSHIVAAYSFDEKGVWVAETVSEQRKVISWDKLFNSYGGVKLNRIFKFYYNPKENWTQNQIDFEQENNFLAGEK